MKLRGVTILRRIQPALAVAAALVVAAEARAGLLFPVADTLGSSVDQTLREFAAFDFDLANRQEARVDHEPFADAAGAEKPRVPTTQPLSNPLEPDSSFCAAAPPAEGAGAGAVTFGQGPFSQVPAFSPVHELPTPQVAMGLRVSDQTVHILVPPVELFRPPRCRVG